LKIWNFLCDPTIREKTKDLENNKFGQTSAKFNDFKAYQQTIYEIFNIND